MYTHSPIYRIGGDEFAVILQGRDYEDADALMAKLKRKLSSLEKLPHSSYGKASLATGIAKYNPGTDFSISDVIKRADEAMYANKKSHKKEK